MATKLDAPQGRGDFFKSLGTLMAGFLAERVEDAITGAGPKLLRPPGALDEFAFLVACTRCDKCVEACPQGTLFKAGAQAGLAVNTPTLHPRSTPCFLCTTLPCIPACPEGALVWPAPREAGGRVLEGPAAVRMGTARVRPARCLTYPKEDRPAVECRICVDRCPYPEEAIHMEPGAPGEPAHPQVRPEVCTGCGLCTYACPAPDPAIEVVPAAGD